MDKLNILKNKILVFIYVFPFSKLLQKYVKILYRNHNSIIEERIINIILFIIITNLMYISSYLKINLINTICFNLPIAIFILWIQLESCTEWVVTPFQPVSTWTQHTFTQNRKEIDILKRKTNMNPKYSNLNSE